MFIELENGRVGNEKQGKEKKNRQFIFVLEFPLCHFGCLCTFYYVFMAQARNLLVFYAQCYHFWCRNCKSNCWFCSCSRHTHLISFCSHLICHFSFALCRNSLCHGEQMKMHEDTKRSQWHGWKCL